MKIKNCPCCGSEDILAGSIVVSIGEDIFIKCNSCNLKMQLCKEYGWEELLKRWNNRQPMQNIVKQLQEEKYIKDGGELFLNNRLEDCISLRKVFEIVKEEGDLIEE